MTWCTWLCRMHLQIQVDIHSLQGTVCAWVPPPPNDRLWFGFITAPELKAEVTPIVANDVSPSHFALLHPDSPFSQACGPPAEFQIPAVWIGAVSLQYRHAGKPVAIPRREDISCLGVVWVCERRANEKYHLSASFSTNCGVTAHPGWQHTCEHIKS